MPKLEGKVQEKFLRLAPKLREDEMNENAAKIQAQIILLDSYVYTPKNMG